MRLVFRIRQLAVQQTWCKPSTTYSRGTASLAAAKSEDVPNPNYAEPPTPPAPSPDHPTAGPSRLPLSSSATSSSSTSSSKAALGPTYFTSGAPLPFAFPSATSSLGGPSSVDEAALIQHLEDHLAVEEDDTYVPTPSIQYAEETYRRYYRLSGFTRSLLPRETYRKLIQSIAPKEYAPSPKRSSDQFDTMEHTASKYERRLRIVISNMKASKVGVRWEDYEIALARLARIGHVHSVEAVYGEMISSFEDEAEVAENKHRLIVLRTYAIAKWLRLVAGLPRHDPNNDKTGRAAERQSLTRDMTVDRKGKTVVNSLHTILKEYTEGTTIPDTRGLAMMTHCLNLTRYVFPNADFAGSLDGMLEEMFKKVYGIQLPYLGSVEESSDGAVRPQMNPYTTSALVEWLGRKGEIWKMIAAAEIFGGSEESPRLWDDQAPDVEEEIMRLENSLTTADEDPDVSSMAVSPASSSSEGTIPSQLTIPTDEGDYGPTLSQALAEEAKVDWLGRPRESPKVEELIHDSELHAEHDLAGIAAASDSPPARPYSHFDPTVVPSLSAIVAHASSIPFEQLHQYGTHNYGSARNVTYHKMLEQTILQQNLMATMHVLRAYISAARTQQAQWVFSAVTRTRLQKGRLSPEEREKLRWEKAEYHVAHKAWREENTRRARIRKELQARADAGQSINVLAEIKSQGLERIPALKSPAKHPHPDKDWLEHLQPPPVSTSMGIYVQVHAFLRAYRLAQLGRGATSALREIATEIEDGLSRLKEEHVILSGQHPTAVQMDLASYRKTMEERSVAEGNDSDAPFAQYLRDTQWRPRKYAFDPVAYLFHVNRTIHRLEALLQTTLTQRDTRNARTRRKRLGRIIRARMPENKRADPLEGLLAAPDAQSKGSFLDIMRDNQPDEAETEADAEVEVEVEVEVVEVGRQSR